MQNQNQSLVRLVGLLILIGVLCSVKSFAQTLSITGKVIDAETHEPLPYATISLKKASVATITNLAGEFDFFIPNGMQHDELVISTLGYVNFEIPVSVALAQSQLLVRLDPGHVVLDEVVVTEELSAANLLRIALSRIVENYPMTPVEMDGFYRETKKVDNEYVGLLEAAVKIYDKDYNAPRDKSKLRERVSLVEVRRTLDYDYSLEKFFSQYNMLEDLLLENLVKYRTFNNEEELFDHLQRQVVAGYNNQPINLVYLEIPGYSLKIYIDDNYGIRKIIFNWGDGVETLYSYRKSKKLENNIVKIDKQIEFQEINGTLYLKYIAARYQNNWINRKYDELVLTTERDQALLINQLNYTNPEWIDNAQKMKRYGLQYQHDFYNKEFWDNYNTIKEMPLKSRVQFDLEKLVSLEQQFEQY